MKRVCNTTGLTVLTQPLVGWRIAKSSYGALSPLPHASTPLGAEDRAVWSRFDTAGSTVYIADTRRTAFLETLAPIRLSTEFRSAIAFAAEHFGKTLAEAQQMVEEDWIANGNMVPGWLPASWRDGRLMYKLQVPATAQWVDLTDAVSIAALNHHLGVALASIGEPEITLGTFTGNNRLATTMIAEWIREQVLDDGSYADGIKFHSKYGTSKCWAYWLRRRDLGLSDDPITVVSEQEIHVGDRDLKAVHKLYGANSR